MNRALPGSVSPRPRRAFRPLAWLLVAMMVLGVVGTMADASLRPARAQDDIAAAFRETLGAFGRWNNHPRWGAVWTPANVPKDWRPYRLGHWVFTGEWGWFWVANEQWGWIVFHYGRWLLDPASGWIWVPGKDWAPAWVRWRRGEAVIGWSPMPPDVIVGEVEPNAQYWVFVAPSNLVAPNAADVILPPAAAKIEKTVVVNQTVIRRNNGVPVGGNPGVLPAVVVAMSGQPVQIVGVQPFVIRGTVGVVGALVGPPEKGQREIVTPKPVMVKAAESVPPPVAFHASSDVPDRITVSACPVAGLASSNPNAKLPVTFQIDCSHVADPEARKQCRPFIENVACKVFPAYRKIMGVKLEQRCPLIVYAIVDSGPLPHGGTSAGGTAFYAGCNIEYMAKYSILYASKIGPWDVHELLHHYEWGGPGLPNMHSLFQSLMTEAMREIGDDEHYDQSIANMRKDVARTFGNNCYAAQSKTEEMLYLEDSSNVYRFVRELDRGIADPNERMNRMLFNVSGRRDSVRKFLTDHGCVPFR